MCGFSCYFHFDNERNEFPNLDLDNSLQNIHHRGPDSRGKYISPCSRCALGHVRLSIIDLAGGQQPLSNDANNIHCVVNGELYDFERIRKELQDKNYNFKTKSDSEIALHLYEEKGLSMFDDLRGEFAFCIFDKKKDRFIAARDRYGIKPVFYTVVNNTLLTASEIKAFLPMGWKPEWDIDSIVNNGPLLDFRTCFKGVYKLPPSHYLVASSTGSLEIHQYWDADYPDKNEKETRTVEEMIKGVRERLVESVKLRLRADVPVGVYLSGGIDSSCIAGIATKLLREQNPEAKIRAFCISFSNSRKYDESAIAERTAAFCGAEFQKLSLTEDDLLNNFEDSVWHVEHPQINLNSVGKFMLSAMVHDQDYKVVLTGEGSDEHFAGYAMFQKDYLLEADKSSPNGFGTISDSERMLKNNNLGKNGEFDVYKNVASKFDNHATDVSGRMVNGVSAHKIFSHAFSFIEDYYNDDITARIGEPEPARAMVEAISGIARSKAINKWHPLHTSLYIESRTFLANYLCAHLGDRCEMAHSVEARTPFLDHHLCEYVNNIPPSLKIKCEEDGSLNEKWILKEAVKPYITEELYTRTKHPYLAPASKGKNEGVTKLVNKLINEETIAKLGWVNFDKINKTKTEFFETGEENLFKDLMIMMSYVVISERFQVATYGTSETVAR